MFRNPQNRYFVNQLHLLNPVTWNMVSFFISVGFCCSAPCCPTMCVVLKCVIPEPSCHRNARCAAVNRSVTQIPQCTSPTSHNAPFCSVNGHMYEHFSFLSQNVTLKNICFKFCGVSDMGLLNCDIRGVVPKAEEVLPHTCPWFTGFCRYEENCISNAGSHGHTYKLSQSGHAGSRSQPIIQCPIGRTRTSTLKQWAAMAIVVDKSSIFEADLGRLSGCIYFASVG